MELSQQEFLLFREWIHLQSGLYFADHKQYFVEKNLRKRLQVKPFVSYHDYYCFLKSEEGQEEVAELLDLLTNNETYFYRHPPQLEAFAFELLPLIAEQQASSEEKSLSIWSAGCSSGEEIYTLAILLQEHLPQWQQWSIRLLGSDLDRHILQQAQQAQYNERSIKDIPSPLLEKYFTSHENSYQLAPEMASMVQFEHCNLVNAEHMATQREHDVIFCRNVLIYFSDSAKKQVIQDLYQALKPGGFLFLGMSESLTQQQTPFEHRKLERLVAYQKGVR